MNYTPESFLSELEHYAGTWAKEPALAAALQRTVLEQYRSFVLSEPGCYDRSTIAGHITGSAVIVSRDFRRILLTHHRKLNEWLQLGGHADGDPFPSRVALREGEEESGLTDLKFVPFSSTPLFDLDIHVIPAHKQDPEHLHYDARYLLWTHDENGIRITNESKDLRWFDLEEAYALTRQWSMHRLFDKVKYVRERFQR